MISYEPLFEKLKEAGITSYKLRQMSNPIIAQATMTRLKNGKGGIDNTTLDRLCKYFDCQPGDLMQYTPDPETQWQRVNLETGEMSNTDFALEEDKMEEKHHKG